MVHQKDLFSLNSAPMTRINELARYCNLSAVGMRGVWWVRKSATSPVTRKEYFFKRSTKTADLRTAVIRALPQVEEFLERIANPRGPAVAASGETATLSELFAAYRSGPSIKANARTRERNIGDITRIIRLARGTDFDVEHASCAIIAKPLAKDFQSLRLALAAKEHGKNLAGVEASKRAMNSTLKHAQSLFSREAMEDYGALRLPATVAEFAAALPVPARKAEEPEKLPDALVIKLMAAMAQHKAVDAAVWTAFQLMVWGGLRNKECLHSRKSWLEEIPAGYRLSLKAAGDFLPKGRSRPVILPANIVQQILAAVDEKDDHLVPALNVTDRNDAIYRRLNAWLRAQGVEQEGEKVAYRLRKYFLKMVEEQQGILMAQAAAGHASMRTTMDHYTGAPKMATPITLAAG